MMKSDQTENLRLIICSILSAASLAALTLLPSDTNLLWFVLKLMLIVEALSSFLFVLFTGTKLKFKKRKRIDILYIPERLREIVYDTSIDAVGFVFIGSVFGLATELLMESESRLGGILISGAIILALLGVLIFSKHYESKQS